MFLGTVPAHSSGLTAPRRRRIIGAFVVVLLTLTAIFLMPSMSARAAARPGHVALKTSAWGYGTSAIHLKFCDSTTATWFHITMQFPGDTSWQKLCLGGTGTWTFGGANITRWTCSGNNHGNLTYWDSHQHEHTIGFLAGFDADWSPYIDTSKVQIKGWSGNNTC